jgi:dolichol-phosphate mannosyltransferase
LKLSLVVPARNEAASLPSTLAALADRLAREGIDYEIVVVDDGSTDGTDRAAQEYGRANPRVVVLRNSGPHGYGRAVALGLSAFSGEAVVIVMADGSDDPADVVAYYQVLAKRADCAFGSRWIAGARVVEYPWAKRLLNRVANTFIRVLFGLSYDDVTNAFKGYRREVIEGCRPLLSQHFNLTVELPLKAIVRGFSHEVVPIRWYNRRQGISKLKIEEMGSRYLYIVLIVWLEKLLTRDDYRRRSDDDPGS